MHEECLVDDILTKTYGRVVAGADGPAQRHGMKQKSTKMIWKKKFTAKLHTDDTANDSHTTVTIRDLSNAKAAPKTWTEKVACLKCRILLS
jgi:hypothetical protein